MIIRHALINIYRQRRQSFLIICVAFILFLLFFRFIWNIKSDEAEIQQLYDTVEVTGLIKPRASAYSQSLIPMELVNKLNHSGFIKHEILDARYYAFTFSPMSNIFITDKNNKRYIDVTKQASMVCVTDIAKSSMIPKGLPIDFADGYDASVFAEDQPVCIVSKKYLEKNDLSYGDKIGILGEFASEFTMYWKEAPEETVKRLGSGYVLTICGSYDYGTWFMRVDSQFIMNEADFIIPARAILDHFEYMYYYEQPKYDIYLKHTYDFILEPVISKASFLLQNTGELSTFRNILEENNLSEDAEEASDYEFVINDSQLLDSVRPLQSSLNFKKHMLGLVYFLICMISFFVALVHTYRRMNYIAILCSLGTSKGQVFAQILTEHALLGGAGVLLVLLLVNLVQGWSLAFPFLEILLYYLIYLLGSVLALMIMLRISTMHILARGQE